MALPLAPAALCAANPPLCAAIAAAAQRAALAALGALAGQTVLNEMNESDDEAEKLNNAAATAACATCLCQRVVVISKSRSPEAAQHIVDAQAAGHPSNLTLSRAGRNARRRAALSGIPTIPGLDRDEYPPAVFAEGGAGSSVRHIPIADNRSAGGQMSAQLRKVPDRCKITFVIGP